MINLESKTTFESKAFPGIKFTIRKYTEGVRHELRRLTAGNGRELNEAGAEMARLRDEYVAAIEADPAAKPTPEFLEAISRVDDIRSCQIEPAYVRAAFVSVDGVQIDGRPLTANDVIQSAPRELYTELYTFIADEYGLTEREKGESEPPSICGAAEGGSDQSSNAPTASDKDSTSAETAAVISPTK